MPLLSNGYRFPSLTLGRAGGGELSLPGDLAGSYGVILIYRGSWCPYCNAQLAAFSRQLPRLDDAGIKLAAFSVDDEATTLALQAKHNIAFPLGYGADAEAVAAATGAYTNPNPRFLQSTGFVLDPDGRVVTAVYSSGAIGRLVPEDVLGFVRYLQTH
jgi:peroxiredoxin